MKKRMVLIAGMLLSSSALANEPNVLFIAVDDLNHWVEPLGRNPQAKTPNIQRLADMGVTFVNAQCAVPACNPSRGAAILDEAELSKPWRSRGGRGGCADGRMRSFRESDKVWYETIVISNSQPGV